MISKSGENAGLLNGHGLVVALILMVLFTAMNLFDTEEFGGALDPRLSSMVNYNGVSQTMQPTDKFRTDLDQVAKRAFGRG